MKVIQRYFHKTVLYTTSLVLLGILAFQFFIQLVHQVQDLGVGHYNLLEVMKFVFMQMPSALYSLFPMAALLGVLLGLSMLDSHFELVAVRAAGVSFRKIIFMVLKTGLILVCLITLMGETIAPSLLHSAEKNKTLAMTGGQTITTSKGVWIREGNDFVHIDNIVDEHHFNGISRYTFDDEHRLVLASYSEDGVYEYPNSF